MIKYVGAQRKRTISISGNSSVIFATTSSLDQGIYRIYESSNPSDYITIAWNGTTFKLITLPDSVFIRQNLSVSDKICFYVDSSNLVCSNKYSASKTLITWLEN